MTSGLGSRHHNRRVRRAFGILLASVVLAAFPAGAAAVSPGQPPSPSAAASLAPERVIRTPVVPRGWPAVHVPILMYHYVGTAPPGDPAPQQRSALTVSPAAFDQQLDWLSANGYHAVDMTDLRAYLAGLQDLPSRPVVLTFDDGSADLYTTAYPQLLAHRMKAVAFIVSGFLDAPGRVTRDQVVRMSRHGVEIGSHTLDHLDLTKLPPERVQGELQGSKHMLEGLLGMPVPDFAYPAGRHNPAVDAAVAAAGYESASTTDPGTVHAAGDRYAWTRVRVVGGESLGQFVAGLGPTEPYQVRESVAPTPSPPNPSR